MSRTEPMFLTAILTALNSSLFISFAYQSVVTTVDRNLHAQLLRAQIVSF